MPQRAASRDLTIERLRLERAIAALASGYRIVLVLHDVEGYNHEEIARYLGASIGTCKSQLHKARKKLRELLLEG
jgi:RNA polymerase sigma-70 factor (ECF subfamily)